MAEEAEWVAKRYNSSLSQLMQAIYGRAKMAVEAAEQLSDNLGIERSFGIDNPPGDFQVWGQPFSLPPRKKQELLRLEFKVAGSGREIQVVTDAGEPKLSILPRWNVKEERVVLFVEMAGRESCGYTVDQIVQLALEPLFFA